MSLTGMSMILMRPIVANTRRKQTVGRKISSFLRYSGHEFEIARVQQKSGLRHRNSRSARLLLRVGFVTSERTTSYFPILLDKVSFTNCFLQLLSQHRRAPGDRALFASLTKRR